MISACCLLVVRVREKQTIIRRAIVARKMKFDRVSNPSHFANDSSGFGMIAMVRNTKGRSSQAIEFLIEREFRLRQIIIIKNSINAAMDISICKAVIVFSLD